MPTHSPILQESLAAALLRALLLAPFQNDQDLADLLARPVRLVRREVQRLYAAGLILALRPRCLPHPKHLWYLTPAGLRLLAQSCGETEPARFARQWHYDLPSLARVITHLPQIVTIQGMLTPLITAMRAAIDRAYAPTQMQDPAWYWVREYATTVRVGSRHYPLHADGLLVHQVTLVHPHQTGTPEGERLVRAAWMVLDPGVGTMATLRPRLEAFYRFRQAQERVGITTVPPLWIVAASPYRASLWRRAARSLEGHLGVASLPGIIQVTPPDHAACWPLSALHADHGLPAGEREWTRLETGEQATLRDLFGPPFPPAAIPPRILPLAAPLALDPDAEPGAPSRPHPHQRPLEQRLTRRPRPRSTPAEADAEESPKEEAADAAPKKIVPTPLDLAHLLLTLTPRHLFLLDLLAAHPLIALQDLAMIVGCSGVKSLRVNRLSHLVQIGLVALYEVPCAPLGPLNGEEPRATTVCATLTARAWHLLSAMYQIPHTRLSQAAEAETLAEHRASHGAHTIGVMRFFAWLIGGARAQGDGLHRLRWWETGAACVRRCVAHDAPEEPITIRPDGIGEYAWGHRRVRFWLEWDMGTMRLPQMTEKFRAYAAYAASQAYRDERPRSLPLVLVVVPTAHREQVISTLVQDLIAQGFLAANGPLSIRTTTFDLLAEQGPLAAIWWAQMPVRRAAAPRTLTLLDEVRPLPPVVALAPARAP